MFSYCIHVLHLSEPEAYLRITTARAARSHPVLLAMLADGRLHLSGIAKLAPHLTPENRDALLSRATHRSKRQILELIAEICPRPDVPSLVRSSQTARDGRWPRPSPPRLASMASRQRLPQLFSGTRCRLNESGPVRPMSRHGKAGWARRHSFRWPGPRIWKNGQARRRAGWNSVRAESAPRGRSSSRWLRPATRCSSQPAPSSKTSWSGSRRCCARRFPMAIWARSSIGP